MKVKRIAIAAFLFASLLSGCSQPGPAAKPRPRPPAPQALATWPWPQVKETKIQTGIKVWRTTADDGTLLELFEFDFSANPALRLELYDQDQDDDKPFDNAADYSRTIDQIAPKLNAAVAWNGPFFAYDRKSGVARHIGPVVLDGKLRFNVGNHRWTFGVRRDGSFETHHLPSKREIEARKFAFAASGLQCLIRDGKALRLEPFPTDGSIKPQPVTSTPEEAGHIPIVDHMRTSRTSMGWSKSSDKLYLLVVKEADNELESKLALKRGGEQKGGWTLDDLQRFWISKGVWGAINNDGGIIMQRAARKEDGNYDVIRPGIPEGTLMTWYVR